MIQVERLISSVNEVFQTTIPRPAYTSGSNFTVLAWDEVRPFHVVLLNKTGTETEGTAIAAVSQPFLCGSDETTIFL
jgi:hypothetical protein